VAVAVVGRGAVVSRGGGGFSRGGGGPKALSRRGVVVRGGPRQRRGRGIALWGSMASVATEPALGARHVARNWTIRR